MRMRHAAQVQPAVANPWWFFQDLRQFYTHGAERLCEISEKLWCGSTKPTLRLRLASHTYFAVSISILLHTVTVSRTSALVLTQYIGPLMQSSAVDLPLMG
jgi:hypothetical protein